MLSTVLFIVAAVLFAVASIGVTTRIHLGWLGAFFLALAFVVTGDLGGA